MKPRILQFLFPFPTRLFLVHVRGRYHYHFATLVFSRKLSSQRLGCDPLLSSSPRGQFINPGISSLPSARQSRMLVYTRESVGLIMQAVRHIARNIAYLDPIGHRTSDSAYSLQMRACKNACTCRRYKTSQCVRFLGSCWSG